MSDEDDKDSSNLVNKDFLSKSDPSCVVSSNLSLSLCSRW